MPFANIGAYVCQSLQVDLVDFFGQNSPEMRTLGSVSLVKWLLSPQNTANFKQINVESIPGKKRAVAFMLEDPFCFDIAKVDGVTCTTERIYRDPESKEIVFSLDGDAFRPVDANGEPEILRFKLDDLMKYCTRTDMAWAQRQIFKYLLQFEKALDKKLTTSLLTYVPIAWEKDVPVFLKNNQTGGAVVNPEGIFSMNQYYQNIGMDGNYAVIGGDIVNKLQQFLKWTCCNSAGVDMSKADASTPFAFYDRNFNAAIGDKDMLMIAPGAAQFVSWNQYKGERKRSVTDLYTKGTIVLPTTGLTVDYTWMYDYKCDVWEFEVSLYGELAVVPAGGCGAGATANGLIKISDCGNTDVMAGCVAP